MWASSPRYLRTALFGGAETQTVAFHPDSASPVQAAKVNLGEPKHFLACGKCSLVFHVQTQPKLHCPLLKRGGAALVSWAAPSAGTDPRALSHQDEWFKRRTLPRTKLMKPHVEII